MPLYAGRCSSSQACEPGSSRQISRGRSVTAGGRSPGERAGRLQQHSARFADVSGVQPGRRLAVAEPLGAGGGRPCHSSRRRSRQHNLELRSPGMQPRNSYAFQGAEAIGEVLSNMDSYNAMPRPFGSCYLMHVTRLWAECA